MAESSELSEPINYDIAKTKIKRYFDRPNSNEMECLSGNDLKNIIGFALNNLPISLPMTDDELMNAENGDFCYFFEDCLKAIEVIEMKLYEIAESKLVKICIIPIILIYENTIYELPIFRLSGSIFIDNCGRYYSEWNDWKRNNKLPPGVMIYPSTGHLLPDKDNPDWPDCAYSATPSAKIGAKVMKGLDVAATLTGVGIGVTSFFTGGLALAGAAIGTTVYGLIRSGNEIVDRGMHKESLNPLTDSRARMVWLGVAADVVGFGIMGSSMKMAFIAGGKGKTLTEALKVVASSFNAMSFVLDSQSLTTSYVELLDYLEDLREEEIVYIYLQTIFFEKGAFIYRKAEQIIAEARNGFFTSVTKHFNKNELQDFEMARLNFQNDIKLLNFMRSQSVGSPQLAATVFTELCSNNIKFCFDDEGRVKFGDGDLLTHTIEVKYLAEFPSKARIALYSILDAKWEKIDWNIFNCMREEIYDDPALFNFVDKLANHYYGIAFKDAAIGLCKFYRYADSFVDQLLPRIDGKYLLIAHGHQFTPRQLYDILPEHLNVIYRQLLPMNETETMTFNKLRLELNDDPTLFSWIIQIPEPIGFEMTDLLNIMYNEGLFKLNLKMVLIDGHILIIYQHLSISMQKLNQIGHDNRMIIILAFNNHSHNLFKIRQEIPWSLRFKYEQDRQEAVTWFNNLEGNSLPNRYYASHEMDRLIGMKKNLQSFIQTWKNNTNLKNAILRWALTDIMTVSEFASQLEYSILLLNDARLIVDRQIQQDPRLFVIEQFLQTGLINGQSLTDSFNKSINFVKKHQMIGTTSVTPNLTDSKLISAVQLNSNNVKFGSAKSAAYHIKKHPMRPFNQYLALAQWTIRDADHVTVNWSQDGTARTIIFENINDGFRYKAIVLEDRGFSLLCTFWKNSLNRYQRHFTKN